MTFIIDANNLAGQLGLLGLKDFDRELIGIIKECYFNKGVNIVLVFDGVDLMGDKYRDGNIEVIYTPKDSFYRSADDKIIELVANLMSNVKDEVKVITDDRGIIDAVEKLVGMNNKIKILKASDFAEKLNEKREMFKEDEEDDKNLSDEEVGRINEDLLKIWK